MSKKIITEQSNKPGKHRPTVAAFLDVLNHATHERFWRGLVKGSLENDINLLIYSELYYFGRQKDYNKQTNAMLYLADYPKIDGIINWATTFSWIFTKEKIKNFLKKIKKDVNFLKLQAIPDDMPVVIMESFEGMKKIMRHLIIDHGFRKIAYLRGATNHLGADERYKAYLESLKEFDIPFDESIVSPLPPPEKYWLEKTGEELMDILLDRSRNKIEAVVSVGDTLAYGALITLKKRGIKVPDDITLTGFDNHPNSYIAIPSITTVDPQFEEVGRKSIEMFINITNNKDCPLQQKVDPKLILRQSCSCYSPVLSKIEMKNEKFKFYSINVKGKSKLSKTKYEQNVIDKIKNIVSNTSGKDKAGILVKSFIEEIENGEKKNFIHEIIETMQLILNADEDPSIWYIFFSSLYNELLKYLNDESILIRAINLILKTSIIISETKVQYQNKQVNFIKIIEDLLSVIEKKLFSVFDIKQLMTVVASNLSVLGIKSCYISLYENRTTESEWSTLILAVDNEKKIDLIEEGVRFQTINLLPKGYGKKDKKQNFAIMPLYFQNEQLGFALFEIGHRLGIIYEKLRSLISNAIKGALLVAELKNNHQKMVVMEKMASLGRLTAGLAHEMNTPLATVNTAMKEMTALINEYKSSIDNPGVLPEDHKAIASDMIKWVEITIKSIKKTLSFIRGIKGQTINLDSEAIETFNASHVISDVIDLLDFKIIKNSCSLNKNLDSSVLLVGNKNWLSQITTNLINNAIEACSMTKGIITINLIKSDRTARLTVEDTGDGINEENIPKIFDPLFTTKPFGEASGLGLTIVQEMVSHFKGTIKVESKPGHTAFTVEMPLSS